MKWQWFVRKGILYWPVYWAGWVVLMTSLALAVYLFIDIDSRSHSVSDTLINWLFNLLVIAVAYTLIALVTERPTEK